MAFEDEVQRIVAEISRRMTVLGEDGPTPDFWTLVGSRLAEEARRLGVDRLALVIAVQSALADRQEATGPSQAMTDLLASLRAAPADQSAASRAQVAEGARSLLASTVGYVVQEAYKGSALSFWHVLVARLRTEVRRGTYPGPALVEELLATVREQTGIDAERRPNEAAVVLCRRQLQSDFQQFAARTGTLRLVVYPDGSVTYRTVAGDEPTPESDPPGAGELYSDGDGSYTTAVEDGDDDEEEEE
jgi:hypothetical protein